MSHCIVAGLVKCGGEPQAGATVEVVLIRGSGVEAFPSTATSGADGIWIIDIDIGQDSFEFRFARILIKCPNGREYRLSASIQPTPGNMVAQALQVMFSSISTEIISRILGLPIVTPLLSTDSIVLLVKSGKVECCPHEGEGDDDNDDDEEDSEGPQIRTRLCFDLSGTATSAGRGGVTVSGISVITDISTDDTAESVLTRLANMLRARGFDVQGPTEVPGTDKVIMYVNSDAVGQDPSDGGIGTLDVQGLGRLSASRQSYQVALAAAIPNEPVQVIYTQAAALNLIELQLMDIRSGEVLKYFCDIKGLAEPGQIGESLMSTFADVTFSNMAYESGRLELMASTDHATDYRTVALAAESDVEITGLRAISAGSSTVQIPSNGLLDKHEIPVGMMWVQTAAEPVDTPAGSPVYRQKLYEGMKIINNPAATWSSFIACDRVMREDTWASGDTIAKVISRWKAFIEAARAAGVKCSIGYVWKLFRQRPDSEIEQFVDAICNIPDVDRVVESWSVVDEPLGKSLNKNAVRDLVRTINDRQHQPANGDRDWPFHIVLGASVEGSHDFWPLRSGYNDRYYDPDPRFKNYIDAIATFQPAGAGARVIISLFYYPWETGHWRYGSLPPWRKWRFIVEKFRQWYPDSTTHPIHFVLEGGAAAKVPATHLAGHVDMHQQVRMARNYGAQGIWFWGWGNRDNSSTRNLKFTTTHWVDSSSPNFHVSGNDERWGEAVANEVTAGREGISAAIPSLSKISGISQISNRIWIKYWLASRGKVEFRIYNRNNAPVKRIDLGYKNNTSRPSFSESWTNLYDSVAGKYEYIPGVNRGGGDNDLLGTAACWDKRDNDFQGASTARNPYTIHMYVNGEEVGDPVQVNV